MEDFIKSLTAEERQVLGRYLINSIAERHSFDSALQEAIGNLLLDSLPSWEGEGFNDYIARTAQQVIEGVYESIDEIKKEFDGLVKEFNDAARQGNQEENLRATEGRRG